MATLLRTAVAGIKEGLHPRVTFKQVTVSEATMFLHQGLSCTRLVTHKGHSCVFMVFDSV